MGVNWSKSQLQFVFRDAREVEQVIDQLRFKFHIATDHGQRAFDFSRLCRFGLERFERGNYRSERRAQFMRKHCQKMIFRPVGRFDRSILLLECHLGAPAFRHTGRKRHCGDRKHSRPGLQDKE